MLSTDFNDWTDDMAVIQQFDHFFQEIPGAGRPDPDVRFDEDWEYYVVDFQGWSRRRVPMSVAQEYYVLFASMVVRENCSTVALFRQWEPLDNIVGDLPCLVERTEDGIEWCSFVREPCEIREMHKFKHAPLLGQRFDLDGRPVLSLSSDGSHADSIDFRKELLPLQVDGLGSWCRTVLNMQGLDLQIATLLPRLIPHIRCRQAIGCGVDWLHLDLESTSSDVQALHHLG